MNYKNHTLYQSFIFWKNYIFEHKKVYFLGMIAVLVCNLMQVLHTRLFGWILDILSGNNSTTPHFLHKKDMTDGFLSLFMALAFSKVILSLGRYGWRITLARETHLAGSLLKNGIWDVVRFFSKQALDTKYSKGILMNAANSDVNQSKYIFGFTLIGLVDTVFLGLLTVATMLSINLQLTFYSICSLLFIPFFVKKLAALEITLYRDCQEELGQFNDLCSRGVGTIRMQRLTFSGSIWYEKLKKAADRYREKRLKTLNTSLLYIPVMGGGAVLSYLIVFMFGIYFIKNKYISVGDFVAMQGLVLLLQNPLAELGFIISEFQKGLTSLSRLRDIFENDKVPFLCNDIKKFDNENLSSNDVIFEVRKLTFSYFQSLPIFSDLNFSINKGARIGIVGKIGTGKTTLINILSGLERQFQGEVLFMGQRFSHFGHKELRQIIGVVPQSTFLFADSIRSNIKMDLDLSDEQINYFLEIADVKKDVDQLENGLDTFLGEWGVNLSGGQKQRLTLARTLARKTKLLLLDDCLSAVDVETEERILSNLCQLDSDITIIWTAHRESTLKYCDKIWSFDNGNFN